ncbi:hypothetical protein [Saccharothrix longispora]|uniref:hypothetical protein n=1 Tax=Saccharothrix longispora TaxID=33920 RepID=UPI00398D1237|nr:hypothetical protein [Saccharothrix sp. MB29]
MRPGTGEVAPDEHELRRRVVPVDAEEAERGVRDGAGRLRDGERQPVDGTNQLHDGLAAGVSEIPPPTTRPASRPPTPSATR